MRVGVVDDGPRPLFEQVPVETFRAQTPRAILEVFAFGLERRENGSGLGEISLDVREGHETALALHRMIGEITDDSGTDHRTDDDPQKSRQQGPECR